MPRIPSLLERFRTPFLDPVADPPKVRMRYKVVVGAVGVAIFSTAMFRLFIGTDDYLVVNSFMLTAGVDVDGVAVGEPEPVSEVPPPPAADLPSYSADDDGGEDETASASPTDSTTTTMQTDGTDPANDQFDSSGNVYPEGEGNPGGDIVGVRHELGPAGQQCFITDVLADGQETSQGPHIYRVSIEFVAPDGAVLLATVKYDNGPPDTALRSDDQGRPEIDGTLVTAVWDDSDTLRVCVDGGEMSVEVASFRTQVNVVPGPGQGSWVDFALGLGA